MLRRSISSAEALVVVHTFAQAPRQIDIPLPEGKWEIAGKLLAPEVTFKLEEGRLAMHFARDFSAGVLHLRRAP